jgi:enamine deaminase RidA (YjgF/YER057c/UK114 family)
MLRRDHLTAARLTRWLAVSGEVPMDPPFLVEPVLRQLELVGEAADARLQLELTMARHAGRRSQ